MISIIAPCFNEINYIDSFMDNVHEIMLQTHDCELIIIDGGSTDGTLERLLCYASKYEFTLLSNPANLVPISLNMGISKAKHDYIARLDIHSSYPVNYLDVLLDYSMKFNCANVGCRIRTLPGNNSNVSRAIAYCMSSIFGVGNSNFRIQGSGYSYVDTVPFGFFNKKFLINIGGYDPSMIKNEDDELNLRIITAGKKIILVSDISVDYYARPNILKYSKMMFQYGFYKPILYFKNKKISSFRQLVPSLFLVSILISLILFHFVSFPFYLIVISYFIFVLMGWIKSHRDFSIFTLFLTMFSAHFFYGLGYILGAVDIYTRGKIRSLDFFRKSTR